MSQRESRGALRDESGLLTLSLFDNRPQACSSDGGIPTTEEARLSNASARSMASRGARLSSALSRGRLSGASARCGLLASMTQDNTKSLGASLLRPLATDPFEAAASPTDGSKYKRMCIVLPMIHFMVGFMNTFSGTPWQEYLVHGPHPVSPANQALINNVVNSIPWNLKIFAAFVSDVFPIFGRRRVPYLIVGVLLKGGSWLTLGLLYGSMPFAGLCLQQFLGIMGQMITGTMCDTLIVENVKHETGDEVGKLQSRCYFMMAVGSFVSQPVGGWLMLYGNLSAQTCFIIEGLGVLSILLVIAFCNDQKVERVASTNTALSDTFHGVWDAAKLIRVLKPMIFIFYFASMPSNSAAFNSYLLQDKRICEYGAGVCNSVVSDDQGNLLYNSWCNQYNEAPHTCDTRWGGLAFNSAEFSYIGTLTNAGGVIGNFLFAVWLIRTKWHCMFSFTVIFCSAVSALQLCLYFQDDSGQTLSERWHMPNLVFALGDDVVMATANQLLSLPILILMAKLVPEGAEGTTYALVTSMQMVGSTVGGQWSRLAINISGIENYDFSNLWKLTLFCALMKLTSLLLLPLIPRDISDNTDERKRTWAALILLGAFLGGLGYALYGIVDALG